MATNIKKFIKNYKLIMNDRDYITSLGIGLLEDLKICMCTKSFTWEDLLIEEGNIYLFRVKNSSFFCLYELTGIWKTMGHEGNLLTYTAIEKGMRGWNISNRHLGYLKEVNLSNLNTFLYWRNE